jgi:hypothetical protein
MPHRKDTLSQIHLREIGAPNDIRTAAFRAQRYVIRVMKALLDSIGRLITLESQGNVVAAYMRRLNQRAQDRMEDRYWRYR